MNTVILQVTMKHAACIVFLFFTCCAKAQIRPLNYRTIDWEATRINATTVESLATKLTSHYKTDLEKTRAIFAWIAQNVTYNYRPESQRTR
jgi:transglutaminase-like putative cysteine protease